MNSIILISFLLFLIVIILLQVYLSKNQNKWLGLVIPGICLIISLLAVLGMASYFSLTKETVKTINDNGEVVNKVINATANNRNLSSLILSSIMVFLMYNIPTAIFLTIYFGCRKKIKKNLELEKMNIQDLE